MNEFREQEFRLSGGSLGAVIGGLCGGQQLPGPGQLSGGRLDTVPTRLVCSKHVFSSQVMRVVVSCMGCFH